MVIGLAAVCTVSGSAHAQAAPSADATNRLSDITPIAVSNGALSPVLMGQFHIESSQARFIYRVAGSYSEGYSGDRGPATSAQLNWPFAVAVDKSGNIFVADSGNNVVRRVSAKTGSITTVAGTGAAGYKGDNGPATQAELSFPDGLAVDSAGDLYISDQTNGVVRKVEASTGRITTYAGNAKATELGDNGPATQAQLSVPYGLALDVKGNLYIASDGRVREVSATTGIITKVAGSNGYGY